MTAAGRAAASPRASPHRKGIPTANVIAVAPSQPRSGGLWLRPRLLLRSAMRLEARCQSGIARRRQGGAPKVERPDQLNALIAQKRRGNPGNDGRLTHTRTLSSSTYSADAYLVKNWPNASDPALCRTARRYRRQASCARLYGEYRKLAAALSAGAC